MENKKLAEDSFPTKLTFRQKAFMNKLLDVYREMKEPLHYSIVAERLGLSSSTAYDMLRLLEKKGIVTSQYATPKTNTGPGRSNILFSPAAKGVELLTILAGESQQQEEWAAVKARIIAGLEQGKASGYKDVFDELFARIPDADTSLVRCAEIITVLLLNLKQTRFEFEKQSSVGSLLSSPASKLRMSILAGLILGLSIADIEAQGLLDEYAKIKEKYEVSLQELSKENLLKLHKFTREAWNSLKRSPA
ncbi:MAG: helix-turn-helix domain-containing protein [Dehalococcoides mccartyi]|uniref:Helix-turn-helix domain-containing protein n=1 Tax=Dehalococcoides mccartyi TaxID=61435 RepID=A0AB38Z812_9CHLR|nr:helix-turn-helix domain-containing protein [Dehalococcoides mccartyi]WRO06681.1 helix-turn-helix domain-containing protein [Dehalococcoides mccartyi]